MSTKTKAKPRPLIVGALYLVESSEDTDTASHAVSQTLRWTSRGWRDAGGRKPQFACNSVACRVRFSSAPAYWKVVFLRERVKALERAGDDMAAWFPSSSSHRARVVGQWRKARRAKARERAEAFVKTVEQMKTTS